MKAEGRSNRRSEAKIGMSSYKLGEGRTRNRLSGDEEESSRRTGGGETTSYNTGEDVILRASAKEGQKQTN